MKQVTKPNDQLRRQRELRGWSQERLASLLGRLGDSGCDGKRVGKWERGGAKPSPFYQELLISLFGVPADQLGFIGPLQDSQPTLSLVATNGYLSPEEHGPVQQDLSSIEQREKTSSLVRATFESLYTGLEFHVQCITYEALTRRTSLHELQRKLTSALLEERSITMDHERRKLLRHLALLPIQAFGLSMLGGASRSFAPEDLLTHCAAGITACEHLSKGTDLHLAYTAISAYIPTLKSIARNSPPHRKEASELTAQAMLLLATLVLHVEGPKSATDYAQQAASYSEASDNLELTLASLGQLAWISSYNKQNRKALEKAQLAEHLLKNAQGIHPLVVSNTYAVLGAYSAQNGYRDEALTALDMATQMFFSTTATDEVSYLDYDYSELALTWGLAHARTGHPEEALNSFAKVVDPITLATKMPISERVRIEFLNHMALASVKSASKDMEGAVRYWQAGMEGAKTLQSGQRLSEAMTAYEVMEGVWPGEKCIIDLRELAVHW
jgi:transcriptional regulator with XRE-family HTH domain/tetratricopeptide (TPR) repeat protein